MEEFIGVFSAFEVQTTMVVEFYGVIHAIEEAQKHGCFGLKRNQITLSHVTL